MKACSNDISINVKGACSRWRWSLTQRLRPALRPAHSCIVWLPLTQLLCVLSVANMVEF